MESPAFVALGSCRLKGPASGDRKCRGSPRIEIRSQVDARTLDVVWENPNARGSFGVVYFGKSVVDGTEVVCKCPVESSLGRKLWSTELHVNKKLARIDEEERFWPGFIGQSVIPRTALLPRGVAPIALVWEKCQFSQTLENSLSNGAGSLEQALVRTGRMSFGPARGSAVRTALCKAVVKELLEALQTMQQHGIFHRDVKPENILITEKSSRPLHIIDFGSACDWSSPFKKGFGDATLDPVYGAPERKLAVFAADRFDVFSVGLIGLRVLIPSLASQATFADVVGGSLAEEKYHLSSWTLKVAGDQSGSALSRECADCNQSENVPMLRFLRQMLAINPNDRLTVEECLKSPLMN